MLSPEYYENCADIILSQYAELEDAILRDIIRRIMKTGMVTESAKWQAEMLQEAGLLYNDIVKEISDRTDACAEQVKALFEDAGVETVQIDNEIYREAGLAPVDIRQSPSMRQVLEAGYRNTLGNLDNLTRTTASAGQREYIEACNGAYMKVASGAFSYQEAISSAVHSVAENGVRLVMYDSGHRDRLSVAVRRAVLTGLSQTCGEISRMNAEEMGCDLMEIDAHAGARPSHAVWQGRLVSLSGKNTGRIVDGLEVLSLSDIGYGTGAGFKGWNCSHDWFPYFEGFSTPNHTPEELEEMNARNIEWNGKLHTRYEINQMQRRAEQNIRKLKRKLVTYDEAVKNAPDDSIKTAMQKKFQDSAVKLKAAEQKLSEFCMATGNDRDRFREQEIGFGRGLAQRAVWAKKKYDNGLTIDGRNRIIEEAIRSGKISTKLNLEKQNPHILNATGYDPAKNKSYFTVSLDELQKIVDERHGTGDVKAKPNGQIKETITLKGDIGVCLKEDGTVIGETNRITIHYSKKRTHIVPSRGENNES